MGSAHLHWILSALLLFCTAVHVHGDDTGSNRVPITPLSAEAEGGATTGHKAFLQQLDQNSVADGRQWLQYYYYNFQYVNKDAPLFFLVLGGNSELNESCANSDNVMVVHWAKKYSAGVYCLEHRFYGQSLPFNISEYSLISGMTVQQLTYLTSTQGIEDAAKFIRSINEAYGTYPKPPRWVLFGGFYGGSLALWLRQKYPELSIGAVVSSAPVMAKLDLYEYTTAVEKNYYRYNSTCANEIKQGFQTISQLLLSSSGRNDMDKSLEKMLISGGFGANSFTAEYVMNILYAMIYNLATPSENLNYEEQMKGVCDIMANEKLTYVARLLGNMENRIMTEDMLLIYFESHGDLRAWMWQRCNEFGFMESTDAQQSGNMFGGIVSTSYLIGLCGRAFSTGQNASSLKENIEATNIRYGGQFGYTGTNVVLVRGDIDPYNSLQHYVTSESTVKQYTVPGLARCADMYLSTYANNQYLKYVQEQIEASIQEWLDDTTLTTTLASTTEQFVYQKNADFSQILTSSTHPLVTDGIPSLRFSLPDPSNSPYMLNYPPDFVTGIFKRTFSKSNGANFTLNQRFWKNGYYYETGGPSFLILSGMGEASPKWILNNELPIMKIAKEHHADVYLLEHRFYGKSVPEGGFTLENLQYLNIDQALMDIEEFIRQNEIVTNRKQKWILFGGSYAGSLAAWFRAKYGDNLSVGAVASSAPLDTPVDFFDYAVWAEKAINMYSKQCSGLIAQQFQELYAYAYDSDSRQILSSALSLQPAWNFTTAVNRTILQYLFRNIISTYLFATQFNGNPAMSLPANGISAACMNNNLNRKPVDQLAASLNNLRAYFGDNTAHMASSYTDYVNSLRNTSVSSTFSADRCRLYQMCSELGQFPSTDAGSIIFDNILPLNFYLNLCKDVFGAKFTSDHIYQSALQTTAVYGGKTAFKGTNVVFVNGDMDPWSTLSIQTAQPNDGILAIKIAGASHCSDMYPSTSNDSEALTSARVQISNFIANLLSRNTITVSSTPTSISATGNMSSSTGTTVDYVYLLDPFSYSRRPLSPILLIFVIILVCTCASLIAFILAQRLKYRAIVAGKPFMESSALPEKTIIPDSQFVPVLFATPRTADKV